MVWKYIEQFQALWVSYLKTQTLPLKSLTMRILHTADWHLGQRLHDNDRQAEHQHFLDWLLKTLEKEKVDALIVAGDIFDLGNPPNYALRQYYNFLTRVMNVCNNVIITGGNHDSVATLNAPKQLLKFLKIHVIGGATANLKDEIIEIKNDEGAVIGVVGAVPFLRDRDIRYAVAGEMYEQRVERIKAGIKKHYNQIAELLQPYKQRNLPVVATGHLVALGSGTKKEDISDVDRDIYIGNQGNVGIDVLNNPVFDYVALGHIHKPKVVQTGVAHIRYSGSPIPLSFSEIKDDKQVVIVDFENGQLAEIRIVPVPVHRPLKRLKGSVEKVKEQLLTFEKTTPKADPTQKAWVEVVVELKEIRPDLDAIIKQAAEGRNLDIVKVSTEYLQRAKQLDEQLAQYVNLDELKPIEVFAKKCESMNIDIATNQELVATFDELLTWMEEGE